MIKNSDVKLFYELGVIEGPGDYLESISNNFFNEYFDKGICQKQELDVNKKKVILITCNANDKNFKIESFPSLKFSSHEFNYIFELTYVNLFEKHEDKYYFLVSFFLETINDWKLGKPFLSKYQFTLDLDEKTLSFYDSKATNKEKGKDKKNRNNISGLYEGKLIIFIIIIGVLLLVGVSITFAYVLGKKINASRKKKTNELDDDGYDYSGASMTINDDNKQIY